MEKMTMTLAGLAMVSGLGVLTPMAATMTTSGASAASVVPECRAGDVSASYRARDATAGHREGYLLLTNITDHACSIGGFGGVSYVGEADGTQVGAPATRTGTSHRFVLQSRAMAVSEISEADTADYAAACRPTKVDGFWIYIPDETHSIFVEHATTGCADDSVKLIDHKAFRHQYVVHTKYRAGGSATSCTDQLEYANDERSNAEINSLGADSGICPAPEGSPTPRRRALSCTNELNYAEDPRSNAEINTIGQQTGNCPPAQIG